MEHSNYIPSPDIHSTLQTVCGPACASTRLAPMPLQPEAQETESSSNPVDLETERLRALEVQLSLRNQQLDAVANQLKQSNLAFQQFANAVSHDLQAPLRAINGFSHFLQQEYDEQLDETAQGYIGHVVEGARRLDLQIKGLVAFSRVSSREASMEAVDLNAVVATAMDSLVDAGAVVEHGPLPVVHGDRDQLILLLVNLIENGLKFNESKNPRVHVGAIQVENQWQVEVKDNGIGIPVKHQEAVFDMFRRLNGNQLYSGVGAGLAVCRRIVERHGGKIWCSDTCDSGSSVCFSIPTLVVHDI